MKWVCLLCSIIEERLAAMSQTAVVYLQFLVLNRCSAAFLQIYNCKKRTKEILNNKINKYKIIINKDK